MTLRLNGVKRLPSSAWLTCVICARTVETTEMPMLEPTLRTRLNRPVPSVRKWDRGWRRQASYSGTKTSPRPRPWTTPRVMIGPSSIMTVEKPDHLPERIGRQRQPDEDEDARVDHAHQPPDDDHRDHRADAARRHDQAGGDHRIAEQVLQHRRQQRQAGQQHDADDEDEDQRRSTKLRSRNMREVDERMLRRQRMDDEHPRARDRQAELDPDLGRVEPVELRRRGRASSAARRSPSDSMAKPKKSKRALARRLARAGRRQHAEKARMPTGRLMKNTQRQLKFSVSQPPSVGPMIGADHDARAPDGHRLAVAFARVDVEQHGLRQRHQRRAEDALQQRGTAPSPAGCVAMPQSDRGDGEAGDRRSGTARLRPKRSASQPVSGVMIAAATM